MRLPPPAPCVPLPPIGAISEEELKERWHGSLRLRFLSHSDHKTKADDDVSAIKTIPTDTHMLNLMRGIAYQENNGQSETESPCPSPETERDDLELIDKMYKLEYGGGCAKRSVPFPKISLQHKKRMMVLNVRTRDKLLRRQRRKGKEEIKKRKNANRVKRLILNGKTVKNTSPETLPLTPPTSVSAPPTPPASVVINAGSDLGADFVDESVNLKRSKLMKSSLNEHMEGNNALCDTSGDETSSKSTLDLIIPPPKDFEGKNNPFLTLMRGTMDETKKRRSKDAITLPLPLTAVIPGNPVLRTTKRQLSEKDICIGPNGEVKRRRLRRNQRVSQLAAYAAAGLPTASKTATVVPVRPDAKEWGHRSLRSSLNQNLAAPSSGQLLSSGDYALGGRQLRQRHDRSQEKEKTSNPPTPKPSPVKQEPDISMDELKSSVNSYFGAATRIAAGERFLVKAKRLGPAGKVEYLIDWEGPSTGMT